MFGYRFTAGAKQYLFCAAEVATSWYDRDDEDGWSAHAYLIHVFELPNHRVLKARVVFSSGEYVDTYRSMHLESFRPGEWIAPFFETCQGVKEESDRKYKAWSKEFHRKQAKENFLLDWRRRPD